MVQQPTVMNVLFLDDSAVRTEEFRRSIRTAVTVATAAECIRHLRDGAPGEGAGGWDVVFLDHDLGGEVFADSDREDTGMEVVRWIVKERPVIGRVVVHTHYEQAGYEMRERLREAGYDAVYDPFGGFEPTEYCRGPARKES